MGDFVCRQSGRHSHVSSGQGFAYAHDVGGDSRMFPSEQLPGAAESGGDFVENEQQVVSFA